MVKGITGKTEVKKTQYRRFPRYKRITQQSMRMKFDKGLAITFPMQEGSPVYDLRNTQVISALDLVQDALDSFYKYFGFMKLYGVSIEVNALKPPGSIFPSVYTGFVYSDVNTAPGIDTARDLEMSFILPTYGSPTVRKFWRIPGHWQNRDSDLIGYFWLQSNMVGTRVQGPQWECRIALYVKFKYLQY